MTAIPLETSLRPRPPAFVGYRWGRVMALALLALLVGGCSNYDFSRARGPDGALDMDILRADLESSGARGLFQAVWIPLCYTEIIAFGPTSDGFPKGFSLVEGHGFGPLYLFHQAEARTVDPTGAPIESGSERSWLWGLVRDQDERVDTSHGVRGASTWHWLFGLFGSRKVRYQQ